MNYNRIKEIIKKYDLKLENNLIVVANQWFDKVNGNTYRDIVIYYKNTTKYVVKFQYNNNYGDGYIDYALYKLKEYLLVDKELSYSEFSKHKDNNYCNHFILSKGYCNKKDLIKEDYVNIERIASINGLILPIEIVNEIYKG